MNFTYKLQPIAKNELSSQFQIEVTAFTDQNLPVIGKNIELKTVKPTNVAIQWIKSNKNPSNGFINNCINANVIDPQII